MRQLFNLLIGIGMGYFYFPWVQGFVKNKWNNFEISNVNHWSELWKLWQSGEWKIDNASDYFFVIALLGFVPLFVVAWHGVCWIVSDKTVVVKEQTKDSDVKAPPVPVSVPVLEEENSSVLELLGSQNRPPALRTKIPLPKKQTTTPVTQAPVATPVVQAPVAPVATPAVQAPEKISLSSKELLDALGMIIKKSGFEVFQNVAINKQNVQFVAVSANNVTLLNMMPDGEEWVADEEAFNNEPPSWFSENDFYPSPVCLLKQAKDVLRKHLKTILPEEYSFNINAILVIGAGKVLNADSMLKVWEGMNVSVVRFADGSPETLPRLAEKLIETQYN